MEKEHLDYYQTVVNTQRNAEILKAELQDLINLIKLENSSPVEPEVSDANGDLQEITLRVYKHELIDLISDLTYNNENFDPDEWSEFDGERLKKASDIILSHLSG